MRRLRWQKIKANKKKTKWYRIFIKVNLQKDEKYVTSFLVDLLNLRKKINFFYRIGTYELNMVKTLLKMLLDVGSCCQSILTHYITFEVDLNQINFDRLAKILWFNFLESHHFARMHQIFFMHKSLSDSF